MTDQEYYVESEVDTMVENGIEFFYQKITHSSIIVKPHIHTAVEILYIDKGSFKVFADNEEYILHPGDTILFRSHTIHKVYSFDSNVTGYYVLKIKPSNLLDFSSKRFGASYLLRLSLSNKNEKTVWKNDECLKNGITDLFNELIRETTDKLYGLDIALKLGCAKVLLIMLRDIEKEQNEKITDRAADENLIRRIYNSIVYINGNFAKELTAEKCGRLQYMSYSYFSRSFKRIIGMSFKDYLNMTRINHAEKALVSTDKTITEIALECGYNNVSYFISIYRKLKGTTPAAFRDTTSKQNGISEISPTP